ncbi:MAG: alpha-1,2-fucosyltransferase [Rhodocyclaceae bacterium]|nr:MAG: alpha-1,2-fucosyltransferase [Rhodocyclaceae bacterium]
MLGWRRPWACRRILVNRHAAAFRGQRLIVEPCFGYWPGISETTDNCFLVGNWQSEKYFSDIENTIRTDFTFRKPPNSRDQEWISLIGNCQSVSLHVRRGDYAIHAKTRAVLGLLPLDYYRSAADLVASRSGFPEFFIFSDDIPWAREHLDIPFPCHYVDHNKGAESHNDMRLMSSCRHHIIANSSFSWWGAWLNPASDKIVIAPRRWFANGWDAKDLIPEGWVSL